MPRFKSATALALVPAAFLAFPALAADDGPNKALIAEPDQPMIHDQQGDAAAEGPTELNQPYVPGYNQSPETDVTETSDDDVGGITESQMAELPDAAVSVHEDAEWGAREQYSSDADAALTFWDERIRALDPQTVEKDRLASMLDKARTTRGGLDDADETGWEADRELFQRDIAAVQEEYLELPQGRKGHMEAVKDQSKSKTE